MNKEIEPIGEDRSGGIQVIARAATILNALGDTPGGMSLAEIAKAVQLPRSTVQRIVNALGQEEIVHADRSDGVRLGPALLRLVARVHTDVVSIVTPHLERLCREAEETVALGRISGRELAFVHAIVAEQELRIVPRVGASLHIHSTSGGRALLALLSDKDVRALVGEDYERVTEHTVRSAAALLRELRTIRSTGYAWESNETSEGISSVSVAIDTILGRYAISVVLPTARLKAKRQAIVQLSMNLKEALNSEIGCKNVTP
ncbi:IclR family transcriptional regulator [Paraburkholderia sediminicola]|uniref:IclR family transcriptional regulator n=1 Tax=Paraburkholderia sediminicola TaxID=458836 RepID=UPI0038BAF0D8